MGDCKIRIFEKILSFTARFPLFVCLRNRNLKPDKIGGMGMKRMKRWIGFMITVMMMVSLFSGCGKEAKEPPVAVSSLGQPQTSTQVLENENQTESSQAESLLQEQPKEEQKNEQVVVETGKEEEQEESDNTQPPLSSQPNSPGQTQEQPTPTPIPTPTPNPTPFTILFQTVYGEEYTGEGNRSLLWKNCFSSMQTNQNIYTIYGRLNESDLEFNIYKQVLAGHTDVDLYEVSVEVARNLARKKVLVDLSSVNLSSQWMETGATKSLTFNGKVYGVGLQANQQVSLMLYNKKLIQQYAGEYNIADLVAKGQWNTLTLHEIAKRCTVDLNDDGRTDIYGLVAGEHFITYMVDDYNDGVTKIENNRVIAHLDPSGIRPTLERCATMYKVERCWRYFNEENAVKAFVNGSGAMAVLTSHEVKTAIDWQAIPFEYGLISLPNTRQSQQNLLEAKVFVVPTTKENRIEEIALWLNQVVKWDDDFIKEDVKQLDVFSQNQYVTVTKNVLPNFVIGINHGMYGLMISSVTGHVHSWEVAVQNTQADAQEKLDFYYQSLF